MLDHVDQITKKITQILGDDVPEDLTVGKQLEIVLGVICQILGHTLLAAELPPHQAQAVMQSVRNSVLARYPAAYKQFMEDKE